MKVVEKRPMEQMVVTRLRHTHRDPAEWVGTLRDGRRAHIVATNTNLLISIAPDLNEALLKAREGDVEKVAHKHTSRAVPTDVMIETTGVNLGPGVEVNGEVPGDVG